MARRREIEIKSKKEILVMISREIIEIQRIKNTIEDREKWTIELTTKIENFLFFFSHRAIELRKHSNTINSET